MPRHSDFDKQRSTLMGTILFIFPYRDLQVLSVCWSTSLAVVEVRIVIAGESPIQMWHQYIVETG